MPLEHFWAWSFEAHRPAALLDEYWVALATYATKHGNGSKPIVLAGNNVFSKLHYASTGNYPTAKTTVLDIAGDLIYKRSYLNPDLMFVGDETLPAQLGQGVTVE